MAFIHSSADVQTENIGKDTYVWQNTVILKGAKIGQNCNINCNVFIENDVIVGDNVTVKSGVQLWDGISIADNVFIGPNATFTNDIVPRSKQYPAAFSKTIICIGASVGANATIKAGITIGDYAMIGMGSVLTKSILPYTLWYGNPATHKGYITMKGEIIDLDLIDKKTGKQYVYINNKLESANG